MTTIINGSSPSITFSDSTTQTTGIPSPSTSGNVLTSNGSVWTSTAPVASGLGVGQTYSNVTGSRSSGTTYTNSTGKPIFVTVFIADNSNQGSNLVFTVAGSTIYPTMNGSIGYRVQFSMIVPDSTTYSISWNGNANFGGWWELR